MLVMLDLNYLQSLVMTYFICLVLNLFAFGNHFLELVIFLADHIQFFVHRVRTSMRQGKVLFRFIVVARIDSFFWKLCF